MTLHPQGVRTGICCAATDHWRWSRLSTPKSAKRMAAEHRLSTPLSTGAMDERATNAHDRYALDPQDIRTIERTD